MQSEKEDGLPQRTLRSTEVTEGETVGLFSVVSVSFLCGSVVGSIEVEA